jgi:hypothetical protein
MKRNTKATLLLAVLSPYVLSWSENVGSGLIPTAADIEGGTCVQQITNDPNIIIKVYTQPHGLSEPILSIRSISADEQKNLYQNIWQSEIDYLLNNDLSLNYPIPTNKITTSIFTADG